MEEQKKPVSNQTEKKSEIDARKELIERNENWFKFYEILPKILTALTALVGFILLILAYSKDNENEPNAFLFLLVVAGVCGLVYCFASIFVSYSVLHINYLKEINRKLDNDKK